MTSLASFPGLRPKLATHDLVLCRITAAAGPQTLRALAERVYSAQHGVPANCEGRELEFVHAPGSWGAVPLAVGDRALVFLRQVSGKLYEDAWQGHLLIEGLDGTELEALQAHLLGPGQAAAPSPWKALILSREAELHGRVAALANIPAMMPTLQPPFHPGDGLGGAVRTLAEALLLLGPARCKAGFDGLVPTLPLATRDMNPHEPGRVPTTQGLLSFVLVAQNAGELAPTAFHDEVTSWLAAIADRQPPVDAATKLQCGVLAAGFGMDAIARRLLDAPPAAFVPGQAFDGNVPKLCAWFLDALDARADFAAVESAWQGFVLSFPSALERHAVNWVSMHACARLVLGRIAGVPVAQLATRTHQQVMQVAAA